MITLGSSGYHRVSRAAVVFSVQIHEDSREGSGAEIRSITMTEKSGRLKQPMNDRKIGLNCLVGKNDSESATAKIYID